MFLSFPLSSMIPVFTLGLVLCASSLAEDTAVPPAEPPEFSTDILAASSNKLGADMLLDAIERTPGKNVCVSPYPVALLCAAAAAGGTGDTREQLININLGDYQFPADKSAEEVRNLVIKGYAKLNSLLFPANSSIASRSFLFADLSYKPHESFGYYLQGILRFAYKKVDFQHNPEQARRTINSGIERYSDGHLKDFFQPGDITPETGLSLINIMKFKGRWEDPFSPSGTVERKFYLGKGLTPVVCPFMVQSHFRNYSDQENFILLWKTYKESPLLFITLLPKGDQSLPSFIQENRELLSAKKNHDKTVRSLIEERKKILEDHEKSRELYKINTKLFLPRFTVSTPTARLSSFLKKQGVIDCFDKDKAKFPYIGLVGLNRNKNWYIQDFYQKNYIQIDEQGTKAYSAGGSDFDPFGPKPEIENIFVNRPFIFGLYNRDTGIFLFLGAINNPVLN